MTIAETFCVRKFTGKHMLAVLVLFFGTIIAVNLVLAWFAIHSWSGLVAKNGYVESVHFKEHQARITAQEKLGWKTRLRMEKGHLIYALKDKNGVGLADLQMTAILGRPTTEKQDKTVKFRQGRPGEYLLLAPVGEGQWQLDVTARNQKGQTYRKIFRFVTKR